MIYLFLSNLVLLVHALFVAFVMGGGLLALWKPAIAYVHVPALIWGAAVITMGWICPLTPLENALRRMAGHETYQSGFIEHYLLQALYPQGLTREIQILLAILLIVGNLTVYTVVYLRRGSR